MRNGICFHLNLLIKYVENVEDDFDFSFRFTEHVKNPLTYGQKNPTPYKEIVFNGASTGLPVEDIL